MWWAFCINFMDQNKSSSVIDETKKSKGGDFSIGSPSFRWIVGILSGLLSLLLFYGTFAGGGDFWLLLAAVTLGAISFSFLSPWKRINYSIGGIIFLMMGIWLLDSGPAVILAIVSFLIGLSLFLRVFNTTLSKTMNKTVIVFFKKAGQISRSKTTRLILKILSWTAVVVLALLILAGLSSWVAGLSATSIIIILLILIWLK